MDCLTWAIDDVAGNYYNETPQNIHEIIAGIKQNPVKFAEMLVEALEQRRDEICSDKKLCYECFAPLQVRKELVTSEYWGSVASTWEPVGTICPECGEWT